MTKPLFPLGRTMATPAALTTLKAAGVEPVALLARHVTGDWGELNEEDREANNRALHTGARIFSAYQLHTDERVWIITEADRSATTILCPDDY